MSTDNPFGLYIGFTASIQMAFSAINDEECTYMEWSMRSAGCCNDPCGGSGRTARWDGEMSRWRMRCAVCSEPDEMLG